MLTDQPILFVLVLVAAIGIGWLLRGRFINHEPSAHNKGLSDEYFRGLNHLLNEEQDKALEVFMRMVEVDSDTVETHFALGSLFRRRGEVDRAIRIHQNLIARPSLSRIHRQQALYELGEDYMRAGLLDRAENLFTELAQSGAFVGPALRHLMSIYEFQSDWDQAIGAAERLELVEGRSQQRTISHYLCELAELAHEGGQDKRAESLLKKALSADAENIRAYMLTGHLAEQEGDLKQAVKAYRRVIERDPGFAGEVLGLLQECFRKGGDDQGMDTLLDELLRQMPATVPSVALAALGRPDLAREGLDAFIKHYLESKGHAMDIAPAREIFGLLLEHHPRYLCRGCGLTANTLYWQCPSCRQWGSVSPHLELPGSPSASALPEGTGRR